MNYVFLDTSALPRHLGSLTAEFRGLAELVEAGLVHVLTSHVVVQEWISQRESEFVDKVNGARRALATVCRDPTTDRLPNKAEIDALQIRIKESEAEIRAAVRDHAMEFFQRLHTEIIPLGDGDAAAVMENYFRGGPPFKAPKSRDDIPDAFILCAINRVLPERQPLAVVVHDRELRGAAQEREGVIAVESMSELFESEAIKQAVAERDMKAWRKWLEAMKDNLDEVEGVLGEELERQIIDLLAFNRYVHHAEIPDDNSEGLITMVGEPKNVELDWESAETEKYGVGTVSVPVSFETEVLIHFSVFRMDAFSVPEGVNVDFDVDEAFCDAEATVRILANSVIDFGVDEECIEELRFDELADVSIGNNIELTVIEDEAGRIF